MLNKNMPAGVRLLCPGYPQYYVSPTDCMPVGLPHTAFQTTGNSDRFTFEY